ncbi:MAG TPA: TetR/AcrR family transcriptional regulator [Syntrophomonas sp.]|jgi:AcrR family transcriptional regulator|nr:TetR/AcrR family transcriptional regulator [Syntrophomonas sp.]
MDIKDRVIRSCRNLARNKGFYSLTVAELAAAAGISKRTLYRYFPSKEEVISATIEAFMLEMYEFFQVLLAQKLPPRETLAQLLQTLLTRGQFLFNPASLDDLRSHYPALWERIDNFRMQRIKEFLQYIAANSPRSSINQIDPRMLAAIVQASIHATINPDFLLDNKLNFEDAIMQLCNFWITAFF